MRGLPGGLRREASGRGREGTLSADLQQLALILRDAVLIALLVVTSWTDTRRARILNVHTFPAMALGLGSSLLGGGVEALTTSMLGLAAAFLIMFPLFAVNVMRAGDAKLLMAIGALTGPWVAVRSLLISCFLFVPVALVVLLARGKGGNVWEALRRFWRFFYTTLHPALKTEPLVAGDAVHTPFGLVLGLAALLAWKTDLLTF